MIGTRTDPYELHIEQSSILIAYPYDVNDRPRKQSKEKLRRGREKQKRVESETVR